MSLPSLRWPARGDASAATAEKGRLTAEHQADAFIALLRDGAAVTSVKARLAAMETEIAEMMERWEVLGTIAVE